MSLAINIDKVTMVCVAGKWHDVEWHCDERRIYRSSFLFDAYEFICEIGYEDKWPPRYLEHGGGEYDICAKGFQFIDGETGGVISGPMTSIDAVMTDPPDKVRDPAEENIKTVWKL